jgi:Superfamily I DNA and RNA helicases
MNLNLDKLNPSQLEAVKTKDGVYQIIAVAGSGKTEVLTKRVGNLISEHGVYPDEILLLTFSKAAKNEMRDRIKKFMPVRLVDELSIDTFHSLGYKILKKEYTLMKHPLAKAFSFGEENGVFPDWLIKSTIEKIMFEELNIPKTKESELQAISIIKEISRAKNELISPDKYELGCITDEDFRIAKIYKMYEKIKNEECRIDFDDLLIKLYELFITNEKILKKYQHKFKYILVDEAQDNNLAQYEIMKMIAYPQNNIFIVGDDDQSMYLFRGARPDQFVNFVDNYENVVRIPLLTNYRSHQDILNAANNLISKNSVRIDKNLVPFKESNSTNVIIKNSFVNAKDESKYIAEVILEQTKEKGKKFSDFAIIYRNNSQSLFVENEMITNGIPYIIYGGVSFYERKEIKDMIAYLKLANDPHDNESFERVVNTPSRYLGKAFMNIIKEESRKKRCSYYQAMKTAKLTPNQHRSAMKYMDLIDRINENSKISSPDSLMRYILKETKYEEMLIKETIHEEEDNSVLDNIYTLIDALKKYSSITDFIDFHKNAFSNRKIKSESVKLMTIHKSKGLEFPIVFGIGMSEGILPSKHAISSGNPMNIEEERRLAYVLITRARDEIYLSSLSNYWNKPLAASRFFSEIEGEREDAK